MRAEYREQMYEAKARYVEKIMRENQKKRTLTPEQHHLLYELCDFRHQVHTSVDDLWSGNAEEMLDELDTDALEGGLREEIERVFGVAPFERRNLMNADIWWELSGKEIADDDEREEDREEWCDEFYEAVGDINREIEVFLHRIDEKHGTRYCPTGYAREK